MVVQRKFVGTKTLGALLLEILKQGLQCGKTCGILGNTTTLKENKDARTIYETQP